MREWFTTADLTGLPGLPADRSGVFRRAKRESWRSRERVGSGGGREYHISSLPPETRTSLLLQQKRELRAQLTGQEAAPVAPTMVPGRREEMWRQWETKPASVREEAERRLDAVLLVERLIADGSGKLESCEIVAQQVGQSVSTIRGWMRLVKGVPRGDYLPLLAPHYVGRTAFADYEDEIYQLFRDLYLTPEKRGYARCYRDVAEIAAHRGWEMPSPATLIRRFERTEDVRVVVLERDGEKALEAMFPHQTRDRSGFYAMEALNMDGHNLDLAVRWPDGEICRITLITTQDLYSGRIVGYRVAKSESSYDVQLAFLGVCEQWGICKDFYVDNTLAMASKRMTAGMQGRRRFKDREGDADGVLKLLGVKLHWVTTAHGQAKPIERPFRDLAEAISKNPLFSGAYLGNTPLSKPHNYGSRVVSVEEVLPVIAEEIYRHNHQRNRATRVCGGKLSFEDVFQRSYAEHRSEIAVLTPSQRRLLYLLSDSVTASRKDGAVELFGNRYWSPEMSSLRGKQVVVRYNPEDLHGTVYVYSFSGDLLAEAACLGVQGFADKAAAEEHGRTKRQYKREAKKLAAIARRLPPAEIMKMRPPLPVDTPAATEPQDVVRIQPTGPSTLDRLATVPSRADRDANQRRVFDRLSGALDEELERKIQEGRLAG